MELKNAINIPWPLTNNTVFFQLQTEFSKEYACNAGDAGSIPLENLLKEEMVTHSSIVAWEIPWTEKVGRLQFMGLQKSQMQLSDYINSHLVYFTCG